MKIDENERIATEPGASPVREARLVRRIAASIDSDDVKITISGRFTFDKVADARAALERDGVQGKYLVTAGETQVARGSPRSIRANDGFRGVAKDDLNVASAEGWNSSSGVSLRGDRPWGMVIA
ncbi:hypothetical protein GCM10011611_65310 [Aliidongia dinghuensis]|uniref:Uncharacterized protein n=1 Tax=Aliidongia dinghuensis TaxID=1867774 RepID=A0A8J2Z1U7_9PROT|nr:hypothetical protein GCM10011611_65310 [Aliidongia dinghuensis]